MSAIPRGNYRIVVKRADSGDFVHDVTIGERESASVVAAFAGPGWSSPVRADDDWKPVGEDDQKRLEKAESTKRLCDYKRIEISIQ